MLDTFMLYFGWFSATVIAAAILFALFVAFVLPALQTVSLALMICVSLVRAKKLHELNWLKFPAWLWTYYMGFMGGQVSRMSYKIEGSPIYCEWCGVFDWHISESAAPSDSVEEGNHD